MKKEKKKKRKKKRINLNETQRSKRQPKHTLFFDFLLSLFTLTSCPSFYLSPRPKKQNLPQPTNDKSTNTENTLNTQTTTTHNFNRVLFLGNKFQRRQKKRKIKKYQRRVKEVTKKNESNSF